MIIALRGGMNLRDLKYLVALVDYRHFGKAAAVCFVSQPALSIQIKKLENYLGVQLVERTNKSVLLTEIGVSLAEQARQILSQVEELKETAKLSKDPYSGELKIGIIPTLAPYLLPYIMQTLSSAFPKLKIYLVEEQTTSLVEKLKKGKLDASILALPIIEAGFVISPLFEEEFMLAVPHNHPLSKRKTIRHAELANKNLLLLEDGHCLREQALAVCHIAKAHESKSFNATSLETLRHMVASGTGMTLIPKLACKSNDGIAYLAFNHPRPLREIGILWRSSSAKEKLLNDVANSIRRKMENQKILKIA